METETEIDTEALRKKAAHFAGNCDVLCLHALAQPLVDEMQNVIRYQQTIIDRELKAIEYVLNRIQNSESVSYVIGAGTETFGKLTEAKAIATGLDVEGIRNEVLPGSASIYRERRAA
jgi:hypothetical protein